MTSNVNRYRAVFVSRCSELTSVGVKITRSTAGFYIFPDFGLVRESLQRRGIETVGQMCDVILEEAKVAVR